MTANNGSPVPAPLPADVSLERVELPTEGFPALSWDWVGAESDRAAATNIRSTFLALMLTNQSLV